MQAFLTAGGLEATSSSCCSVPRWPMFARSTACALATGSLTARSRQISAFRGADGSFDENAFRAAIAQRRLTESMVRHDLGSACSPGSC